MTRAQPQDVDSEDENDENDEEENVAQVIELLRRVRADNSELKRNFESLKGMHLQLNNSHQQLQSKHAALYEERLAVERQYQALCESWRLELEDKQRGFEAARAQILGPKDLELIKVKLLDEVEGPYQLKCDLLSQEATNAQHNFVRVRREHEELQATHRNLEMRTASQFEAMQAEHVAVVSQLRDQVAELGAPQAKLAAAEQASRTLQRERDSLVFNIGKLELELTDLRRQKERATVDKESVAAKVERRVKDIQAEELQLQGLVESLTRKNRHLQKELTEAHRANEEQYTTLMKAQGERLSMQEQLEGVKKTGALEKQTQIQHYEDTVRRLEDRLGALRNELHERERQVAELNISHQEQVGRLVEAHDARLEELEAEAREKGRQTREQRQELQVKVESLRGACDEYRRECEEHSRKEGALAERAQRETERFQVTAAEAERQAVGKSMEVAELKRELDALKVDCNSLDLNNSHLGRRKEELEAQVDRLQADAQEASAHQQALLKDLDEARRGLEADRVASLTALEQMRQAAATERQALGKRYQANLRELAIHNEGDLKRLRRKLKASHGDVARLTDDMTDLRFRSHELEAASGGGLSAQVLRDSSASFGPKDVLDVRDGGFKGSSLGAFGTGAAGMSPHPAVASSVLADLAVLRERQQAYLGVVGLVSRA